MTVDPVLELLPGVGGRWLIETSSGSRHLLDLDAQMYTRLNGGDELGEDLDAGLAEYPVVDIDQWPKCNSTFRLCLRAFDGDELTITSSFVTRITSLAEDEGLHLNLARQSLLDAVAQAPPTNAWLLMGDDASFPDEIELRAQWDPDDPDLVEWTCPRQIQRGDLVLIYFMAPRKAVHFVARSLAPAVYDPSIVVNANRAVDRHQWWTDLSPLVAVPPIAFGVLRELHGGHLVLRGKPTHYLRPEVVDGLVAALDVLDDKQRLVLQTPVGNPDLPDPGHTSLNDLRSIASGKLINEKMVEQHVVEPLFRLCFPKSGSIAFVPQVRIRGAGVADYGLYADEKLCGVVEVKLGFQRRREGGLIGSPDLEQVVRYASAADVPAALIDSNEVFLIDKSSEAPSQKFERQRLSELDLAEIADHFR